MLKYRIFSGTSLFAIFGLLIFWHSILSSILFLLIASFFLYLALTEFFALTLELDHPGYPLVTISVGLTQFFGIGLLFIFVPDEPAYGKIFENFILIMLIVILFIRIFREKNLNKGVKNFMVSVSGFIYLGWSMTFLVKLYFLTYGQMTIGPFLLFYGITVTKCADIGGYVAGKLTAARSQGNHKLVPRLSPKKSWEGLVGGVLLSMGVSYFLTLMIGKKVNSCGLQLLTPISAVNLAILFSVLGLIGDLSVSVLKRAAKQKDAGVVIPGFGGTLDLLDSLILVLPIFYCLLSLIIL